MAGGSQRKASAEDLKVVTRLTRLTEARKGRFRLDAVYIRALQAREVAEPAFVPTTQFLLLARRERGRHKRDTITCYGSGKFLLRLSSTGPLLHFPGFHDERGQACAVLHTARLEQQPTR